MKLEGVSSIKSINNNVNYLSKREGNFDNKQSPAEKNSNENINNMERDLIQAIESANKKLEAKNTELKFSIHEQTKAIMVKIINKDTDEVVKEIPPEKILDMVGKFMEMAGILVDKKI